MSWKACLPDFEVILAQGSWSGGRHVPWRAGHTAASRPPANNLHWSKWMANESNPTTPDGANEALTPLRESGRVFRWHDHMSLWFSLGVGLLVMQVGAFLVPAVGTRDAAVAIVLGSIIGAGLLAWTAHVGCDSGLASAGLMHATYGSAFARLPVILNIVQLIGWTTFEIV